MFKLDFDIKFPLLRLLQFLSDLKSTIQRQISYKTRKQNEIYRFFNVFKVLDFFLFLSSLTLLNKNTENTPTLIFDDHPLIEFSKNV